ncbi:MAG: translation initiation factor IF-3 [Candidatus Dojkabacteria bacterium]|jgi:translation initiation factor IF-3
MAFDKQEELRKKYGPRRNEYIRVEEVQLIDQEGNNVGVVKTYKALEMAKEAGLDLVEVGPNVRPPVCKIMDYAKYTYLQSKKSRMNKKGKTRDVKEFKFSPVIDKADSEHRINRALEYLEKGYPVRLTMFRKGRQSKEQAKEVFDEILTNFTDYSSIEPNPISEGNNIFVTFRPNGKTKNKQNSKEKSEDIKS